MPEWSNGKETASLLSVSSLIDGKPCFCIKPCSWVGAISPDVGARCTQVPTTPPHALYVALAWVLLSPLCKVARRSPTCQVATLLVDLLSLHLVPPRCTVSLIVLLLGRLPSTLHIPAMFTAGRRTPSRHLMQPAPTLGFLHITSIRCHLLISLLQMALVTHHLRLLVPLVLLAVARHLRLRLVAARQVVPLRPRLHPPMQSAKALNPTNRCSTRMKWATSVPHL